MLCTNCRRTLLQRISNPLRSPLRSIGTVPATKNAAPATPPPSTKSATGVPNPTQSSATPSASQPFSSSFFPSSSNISSTDPAETRPSASSPRKLTSSIPGGHNLQALVYHKQPPAPLLAKEDDEYPDWLWTLLPSGGSTSKTGDSTEMIAGVDVSSMSKKARAKFERKQAKLAAQTEKPVPLHEQSNDLTEAGEGAKVSAERREELRGSMRTAGRKGIREGNFLRSM